MPSDHSGSDGEGSSSSPARYRSGDRVEGQRREGGKWREAEISSVDEDTYRLDFGTRYGSVGGVPRSRIRTAPRKKKQVAKKACAPVQESHKAAPKPRVAPSARGLDATDDFSGDRDAVDDKLRSSLGWLATRARQSALEDALEDRGAGEADDHGWTWLHHAAAAGRDESTRTILAALRREKRRAGDDGDADDGPTPLDAREAFSGWTPLHLACVGRHVEVARLLLNAGASVDAADDRGDSPADLVAGIDGVRAKRVRALLRSNGAADDPSSSDASSSDSTVGFRKRDSASSRRRAAQRRRAPPPRARAADYDYDADPFLAPRYVYGACAGCNALDPCECRYRRAQPKRKPGFRLKFLRGGF